MFANAFMWTLEAECQVLIGRALNVETVRFGKLPLIVIARDKPEEHLVTRLDLFARQFSITRRSTAEVHGHRAPAQDFFGRRGNERGIIAQFGKLLRPLDERK